MSRRRAIVKMKQPLFQRDHWLNKTETKHFTHTENPPILHPGSRDHARLRASPPMRNAFLSPQKGLRKPSLQNAPGRLLHRTNRKNPSRPNATAFASKSPKNTPTTPKSCRPTINITPCPTPPGTASLPGKGLQRAVNISCFAAMQLPIDFRP